nr:PREDICTED: proto-oncogene DBL [Lepisosteus oculatus]
MSKTTIPMALKEVNEYLEKQIAYLSGGRGEESSVIITLPECSSFSEIPEEALAKVLMYLTLTPRKRQPGVKFIIILDRRLDTWMSIKTALARIASPDGLSCIADFAAARFPGSQSRSAVTPRHRRHRGGWESRGEDIIPKSPSSKARNHPLRWRRRTRTEVVMLSSVTDLLHYIDENQLTQDLGGTLEYCHSDWILLRSGIESFAVTVKEIAQMLQAFGTELAETELPKEVTATEFLLMSHTAKYRQLKEDIRTVMRKGRQLLSSLEASGTVEAASEQKRDASQDWETVQRLLAQLHDMETAFDGFFEKHHLKLQQYLQLCRFERSFREMELSLQQLLAQEREHPGMGDSMAQTEQFVRDLDTLDAEAQHEMSRAQILILQGHQLAASHHYALALICQRCNELRHLCDVLTAALRAKRESLGRAQDLLSRLEQAMCWCHEAAYLLADQQVDKFQSKEGAQAALRDIERFLEGTPPPLSGGPDALTLEFESILTPQLQAEIGRVHDKLGAMRGTIQNRQTSLRKLADKQVRPIQLVAPRPETPTRSKSPLFSPKHGEAAPRTVTHFCLALPSSALQVSTSRCPVTGVLSHRHPSLRKPGGARPTVAQAACALCCQGDLSDLGRVLMQGSFSVWISHRKGPTKMKDLARFKPMQRHLFLHERALLFCKRREEHGEGYDKTPSYSFKHCLKMSAVGITENVKGDIKKFEIWYSGREEVYVVQAPSVEVKLAWLSEIRKILTNQQKLTRDDSLQPSPASDHIQLSPPLFDRAAQCGGAQTSWGALSQRSLLSWSRWVRSLSRRQEGRVSAGSLQEVLGESRVLSGRLGDPGNLKTRKLSSP